MAGAAMTEIGACCCLLDRIVGAGPLPVRAKVGRPESSTPPEAAVFSGQDHEGTQNCGRCIAGALGVFCATLMAASYLTTFPSADSG